jgi:hypothetical protein
MSTINKEVYIPKLKMDYLDDAQHLYQVFPHSSAKYIIYENLDNERECANVHRRIIVGFNEQKLHN